MATKASIRVNGSACATSPAGRPAAGPAGNNGAMTPYYPASYPMVLGVGGVNGDDEVGVPQ